MPRQLRQKRYALLALALTSMALAYLLSPRAAAVALKPAFAMQQSQAAVRFNFSAAYYRVSEGDASVVITVVRSGGSDGKGELWREFSVEYLASSNYLFAKGCGYLTHVGSATPDVDYAKASGTLRFAPGESSKTFQVSITDDTQVESRQPESVFLSLDFSAYATENSNACYGSVSTIYIHDNDPLTAPAPAPPPSARRKIVFYTNRDGNYEIYVMDEDGANPRRLTNNLAVDTLPAWSPDGTKVAFVSDRGGKPAIYVMQADGSNPSRLTSDAAEAQEPAWSPDGQRLAFVSYRNGFSSEIFLINADGSNQLNITNNPGEDFAPAWSPDGKRIAFTSRRDNGTYSVYVMDSDGAHAKRIVEGYSRNAAWSPDAAKLAFVANGEQPGGSSIYVVNADGSNRRFLSGNRPFAFDLSPAWSPDGSRILFASNRDGNPANYEIYSMNADGTNQLRLTDNPAHEDDASWQPQTVAPPPSGFASVSSEANSNRAVALDSVTWVLDPFSVVSTWNLSADRRTRVTLFASNLSVTESSDLLVQAEDSMQRVYQLPVEHVVKVPGFNWLTQIVVRLPDELASADYVWVSINARGAVSNKAVITMRTTKSN